MNSLDTTAITRFLEGLVGDRHPELVAMEEYARQARFPIIGPAAGQHCYQLTRMIGARSVFELGSGYGYSTAWFARGVKENGGGVVHHVVWDEELSHRARGHIEALDLGDVVTFQVSEAVDALRRQRDSFDVIFCDIDKPGYPAALDVISERINRGGLLIADNVLWHGRVVDEGDNSESTMAIREFTRRLTADSNWITSVVPVRDGLVVAYRVA